MRASMKRINVGLTGTPGWLAQIGRNAVAVLAEVPARTTGERRIVLVAGLDAPFTGKCDMSWKNEAEVRTYLGLIANMTRKGVAANQIVAALPPAGRDSA